MLKVLLADDHAIVRNVLLLLLERAGGMQVAALASNGQEAVAQAVLYSPNVAVIDVSMPVMDGIEATRLMYGWKWSFCSFSNGVSSFASQRDLANRLCSLKHTLSLLKKRTLRRADTKSAKEFQIRLEKHSDLELDP